MSSKTNIPRIVELASIISTNVAKIQEALSAQNLATPSFDGDAQYSIPQESIAAQDAVLDATSELHDLLLDPLSLLFEQGAHNNMVSLQAISRFQIASIVPASGQISFHDISKACGVDARTIQRILRHAITMHVFQEPVPGMVSHTMASKLLTVPHMSDWMHTGSEEMWPAACQMVDAIEKWPGSQEPNETAFALANHTTSSIYEIIGASPQRAARFAGAMEAYASSPSFSPSFIVDHYDWASLGPARVVDIGGAQGHIAIALADRYSNLKFVVQDMDKVVEGAETGLPEHLKDRVSFMGRDLFSPQTVEAEVYYFRWILHNWSDKYCILMLRALMPVLKSTARIVIQDTCMPEPGAIPRWREKALRAADLNMGAVFNSRERTEEEWKTLLAEADDRFVVKDVGQPNGSALAIIDVRWEGADPVE